MLGTVIFWIFSRFAILNHFSAEPVRIAVFLNDFLRVQITVDLCYFLVGNFHRNFNVRYMLLEILIIQQVIFGKIVKGAGCLFQIIELCPSFKSFSIAGCNIRAVTFLLRSGVILRLRGKKGNA